FGGQPFGHGIETALDSRLHRSNPDHPALRPNITNDALKETLAKLSSFMQNRHQHPSDIDFFDLVQLINAISHPSTLEMLDDLRKNCNKELAEHWLFLVLQRKVKLDKVSKGDVQPYIPSTERFQGSPNCKDVHDDVFRGVHEEKTVQDPAAKY